MSDGHKLIEVVVYLKQDYSENKSLYIEPNLTKEKITEIVNKEFGPTSWFYYDII